MFCFRTILFVLFFFSLARTYAYDSRYGSACDYPEPETRINLLDFGVSPDGTAPCDAAIKAILSENYDKPLEIFFPEGKYLLEETINLPDSVYLTGVSSSESVLNFDLGGTGHCILIRGSRSRGEVALTETARMETRKVAIETPAYDPGDLVMILDDDVATITSDWARGSCGQILKIVDANESVIEFDFELRRDYLIENRPRLTKVSPRRGVKIERLGIRRLDRSEEQTSNIRFEFAAECRVFCVDSRECNFAHAEVRFGSRIEIAGCYFTRGFDYGGGGKAYGAALHFATGDCLIYDCVFERLRHSILLQAGANGNAIAYNYSIDPYWTETVLPANSAGDLVLHGNYPYANFFEGNVVQNIVIDDSHGVNGPRNVFFRNRAELYGIFMNFNPPTDSVSFIGNEIVQDEPPYGLYFINGNGHIEIGNNVGGELTPAGSELAREKSLVFRTPPKELGDLVGPPIGPPNGLEENKIPSQIRYEAGHFTRCSESETSIFENRSEKLSFTVRPNPVDDVLNVCPSSQVSKVVVYDALGRIAVESESGTIDLSRASAGVYFTVVKTPDGATISEVILKK